MAEPDYWLKNAEKYQKALDLAWNFPEQKTGALGIIGGNSASFMTEVKISEFLTKNYPFLKFVKNVFPDSLKKNFPPLENLIFCESTESGSIKRSPEFRSCLEESDCGLILGDLSKNSETALAVLELLSNSKQTQLVLTRDALDLVSNEATSFIMQENLTLFGSLAQLQKLFRALYYPKMLLLSSPLLPVIETLHKFTLSYPVSILTLHEGNIICASNGKVATISLDKTPYSPISLWSGELAAKLAVFKLYNPNSPYESLIASIASK